MAAKVLVTLARTGGRPKARRAGNVMRVPPPTATLTTPATKPAAHRPSASVSTIVSSPAPSDRFRSQAALSGVGASSRLSLDAGGPDHQMPVTDHIGRWSHTPARSPHANRF